VSNLRGYTEAIRVLSKCTADMSERSTRRAINELVEKGIITLLGNGGFQINLEVLEAMPRISADA
jgi:Fic family protein